MARRGRKHKQGRREPNGRLSRNGLPRQTIDKGTDRAQFKLATFGTEGADAIGRAYMAGLLGDNADAIRDTARKIARAYWPMLAVGTYTCTLADRTGGANDNFDAERIKAREQWLTGILRTVDRIGRVERKLFDELVIDINPDHGPAWLDSLIWHKRTNREPALGDVAKLTIALEALDRVMA